MRVVQAPRFGGPEVLVTREVPDLDAEPGQVVVGVSVVDTLFVETEIRAGRAARWFDVEPPYVPGGGVAGEVISVGEGVGDGWIGRRVVTALGARGGYAEQVTAPADKLVAVPDGLDLRVAAALVHDGRTAMSLLEGFPIGPGERVLILGASGGMGVLLVQLAHAAGARVLAAARGERKLELVRSLGADVVVDLSEQEWPKRVRDATGRTGPDVVLDGVGGRIGQAAFELTARGGRFSAHGAPTGGFAEIDRLEAERRGVTLRGITELQHGPGKRLTERALAEAAAGRVKPVIGQTFPLQRAADAHAAIEARDVVAKTLLLTNQ